MNSDIRREIELWKRRRNAVILAHNYQPPEVQEIADHLGDSLELSQKAAETGADTIVFCGVHFMAETAAILSPGKQVLLPDPAAGCPMADMIDAERLKALKSRYPGSAVVCYVNTSAAVKAESDVCCTSANAVEIVNAVRSDLVIFVPDKNLAMNVARRTKKTIILWEGFCPVHARIRPEHIQALKREHPQAEVLAHPECPPETVSLSDHVLSTSGMRRHAAQSPSAEFIVATENAILHRLRRENPRKVFHAATECAVCGDMRKTTLSKVLSSLKGMKHRVQVNEVTRKRALGSINRMLAAGRKDRTEMIP